MKEPGRHLKQVLSNRMLELSHWQVLVLGFRVWLVRHLGGCGDWDREIGLEDRLGVGVDERRVGAGVEESRVGLEDRLKVGEGVGTGGRS